MNIKLPQNSEKYRWTNHSVRKMNHYGLSPARVLRVIRSPDRMEKGIVPETLAAMQKVRTSKKSNEIWVMYSLSEKSNKGKKIIITAWRYPGVSPIREKISIPNEIVDELKIEGLLN